MDAPRKLRVLFLDHEGGWGGASRSLYYLLCNLDASRFEASVLFRTNGPARVRLDEAGIANAIEPDLFNLSPRSASHPANLLQAAPRLVAAWRAARKIAATPCDVLHFNYEGLLPIALLLAKFGDRRPRVLHVRVVNPKNAITTAYAKLAERLFDHIVFITENERDAFAAAGFKSGLAKSSVLYNCVSPDFFAKPRSLPADIFRVSYFGTLDWIRGADRLVDVARHLVPLRLPIKIDIYGKGARNRRKLRPGRDFERQLAIQVREAGLEHMIELKGHTATPELAMSQSQLVIRPSRGGDPWGRDVIEAMSLGVPILASGTYAGFIEDGKSGILVAEWDAERVSRHIAGLARNAERVDSMGMAARARAMQLFDPIRYAQSMSRIYDEIRKTQPQ